MGILQSLTSLPLPTQPFQTFFSSRGPWSMKLCHGFSEEHAQLPFKDIWQETIRQISLKRCHVHGWNDFIEPCGFLGWHRLGLQVRVLEKKKLGHPKTFQKWSCCATRECKTGECVYPFPVVVGTIENRHSLFLFLTGTHQGKQLRETETNCFSIYLIIELWFHYFRFCYQKIFGEASVLQRERVNI